MIMSRKFISLVKVELMHIFTSLTKTRKKSSNKLSLATLSIIVPILLCLYVTGIYTYAMVEGLIQTNLAAQYSYLILVMGVVISVALVFGLTFYNASGHLFQFKDYDLLMSLPIKNQMILVSKLMAFFLYNYFFTFFLLVPPVIGYVYLTATSPLFYVYAIFGSLFLPLIPTIISSILAFIITSVSNQFKYRNIVNTIISFMFLFVIMFGSFKMNDIIFSVSNSLDSILPTLQKFVPPIYFYIMAMKAISMLDFLIYVAMTVIPTIIFVAIFSKSFKRINSSLRKTKVSNQRNSMQIK